ncbi:MAG: ArdC-like ssDNA-binding domain-containing protein [bacterium]
MKFTAEQKEKYLAEKREKIKQLRLIIKDMTVAQRQAVADKYGIVTIEGHPLSPYNQCFLLSQAELKFTVVGGFQQWRKAGRTVLKGKKGFLIFVPSGNKKDDDSTQLEDVYFFTAVVFDISQTQEIEKEIAA